MKNFDSIDIKSRFYSIQPHLILNTHTHTNIMHVHPQSPTRFAFFSSSRFHSLCLPSLKLSLLACARACGPMSIVHIQRINWMNDKRGKGHLDTHSLLIITFFSTHRKWVIYVYDCYDVNGFPLFLAFHAHTCANVHFFCPATLCWYTTFFSPDQINEQ